MLSGITATSALTVYIPPAIYAAGNSIEGEVTIDFRQLREENIEEIQVRLRGSSHTVIHRGETTLNETVRLVREDTSLWVRGSAYPSPGSDTLRVPFTFQLPDSLPPSFHYGGFPRGQSGNIRYSLTAVGVRKGALTLNKRHRVPLAVLPRDEIGAALKAEHATHGWKSFTKSDSIRRGLWGDYSKVHVELSLPDIPVLPLFSDIPYTVAVTTTTPPQAQAQAQARREADASGTGASGKPLFPPVPQSADELEFALHRQVRLRAKFMRASPSTDVALFLGKKREDGPGSAPVEVELPEKEWVPDGRALVSDTGEKKKVKDAVDGGEGEGKGSWVQRATFRSVFRLNCPPAFAVHNIECDYNLVVRVPFPGIGNGLKLEVPVKVTSGIDKPLAKDDSGSDSAPPPLDLPPAYWDANSRDWDVDEKD